MNERNLDPQNQSSSGDDQLTKVGLRRFYYVIVWQEDKFSNLIINTEVFKELF